MDTTQILALHDQHQRIGMTERTMRREVTPEVIRHVSKRHGEGMIIHSRLSAGNADRVIQEQIEYFRDIGQDFEWKSYGHDTPADLGIRLAAHGLVAEAPEALLVLDTGAAPSHLLQPVTHDVRHITDPSRLDEVGQIQERVWKVSDPTQAP